VLLVADRSPLLRRQQQSPVREQEIIQSRYQPRAAQRRCRL